MTVENQNAFEQFTFRFVETDSCRNGGSGFFIKHSRYGLQNKKPNFRKVTIFIRIIYSNFTKTECNKFIILLFTIDCKSLKSFRCFRKEKIGGYF